MAQWNIDFPAGTTTASADSSDFGTITPPGDFDGATINSFSIVGTPQVTGNEDSNDTFTLRFNIQTSTGVNVYGSTGADNLALAYIPGSTFSATAVNIALSASPTPSPSTAVAADWARAAWSATYSVSGKDDASTNSWSAFQIQVDYTPTGGTVNNVTRSDVELASLVTDSATELRQAIREALNTIEINDASFPSRHIDRIPLDSIDATDFITAHRDIDRIIADAIEVNDSNIELRHRYRILLDEIAATDDVVATYLGGSVINNVTRPDGLDVADADIELRERIRQALDTSEVTDNSIPTYVASATINNVTRLDNIDVAELGYLRKSEVEILNNVVHLFDNVIATLVAAGDPVIYPVTRSDAFDVTDAAIELRQRFRAALSTLDVADATDVARSYARALLSTLSATDSVTVLRQSIRALSDSFATTDASVKLRQRYRLLTDSLEAVDNAIAAVSGTKFVTRTDSIEVTDTLITLREVQRQLQSAIAATDNAIAIREARRSAADAFDVTDNHIELRQRYRELLSTLDLIDTIVVQASGVKSVTKTDTIPVTDLIIPLRSFRRTVQSAADLNDFSFIVRERNQQLLSELSATDNHVVLRERYRVLADVLSALDDFTATYVPDTSGAITNRTLTDNIALADFQTRLYHRFRLLLDTISIDDNAVVSRAGLSIRVLQDTVTGIIDDLAFTRTRLQSDLDTIAATDSATTYREYSAALADVVELSDAVLELRKRSRLLGDYLFDDITDNVIALYITEILNPVIEFGFVIENIKLAIERLHINIGISDPDADLSITEEAGQIGSEFNSNAFTDAFSTGFK